MNLTNIKVAFFLTLKYIRSANKGTLSLIFFVMLLTFLNLVVISGILEGIIQGSVIGIKERALGDVVITPKEGKNFIERTQDITLRLESDPRVSGIGVRNRTIAEITTVDEYRNILNKKEKRKGITNVRVYGVNPTKERDLINLDNSVIEGEYFKENDRNGVLVGSSLITRYSPFGNQVIADIYPGDFIYLLFTDTEKSYDIFDEANRSIADTTPQLDEELNFQKYQVRGIIRTKADNFDFSIIMNNKEIKRYSKNPGDNANLIAVRLHNPEQDTNGVKDSLFAVGLNQYADIKSIDESIGSYINDIQVTFKLLGTIVGTIGIIVASITIFIIIFVTAASRSRYIGILKGIGISEDSIKLSYVFYALFFTIIGMGIGLLMLYLFISPYFAENPIDFPFSDGVLYVVPLELFVKLLIMVIATIFAGYIPSKIITKKPAIDSIMGR